MNKIYICILLVLIITSCSKKQEIPKNETIINENSITVTQEENKDNTLVELPSVVESKKIEYIIVDDSVNDDLGTIEYNLQNDQQNFCIGHSVLKIEGFDYENSSLVNEWTVGRERVGWVEQEGEDFSVIWTFPKALVVRLSTISSEWKTKRGIHVGSTRKEVEDAYEKDADIYELISGNYEFIQDKDNELFLIYKSEKGFSINTPNYYSEEMMTMRFYTTDGIVSKIEIKIGD